MPFQFKNKYCRKKQPTLTQLKTVNVHIIVLIVPNKKLTVYLSQNKTTLNTTADLFCIFILSLIILRHRMVFLNHSFQKSLMIC